MWLRLCVFVLILAQYNICNTDSNAHKLKAFNAIAGYNMVHESLVFQFFFKGLTHRKQNSMNTDILKACFCVWFSQNNLYKNDLIY